MMNHFVFVCFRSFIIPFQIGVGQDFKLWMENEPSWFHSMFILLSNLMEKISPNPEIFKQIPKTFHQHGSAEKDQK